MRIMTAIACATLAMLSSACDRAQNGAEMNLEAGQACFDAQGFNLAPGTQYEGIEKMDKDKVLIRIMDGVRVATVECALNPDGSLK